MKISTLAAMALAVSLLFLPQLSYAQTTTLPTPVVITNLDTDKDGLSDVIEQSLGTNPTVADTDGDGFSDGVEVNSGHDPLSASPQKVAKRIVVNLKTQKLAYYFGTTKLDEFPISSGVRTKPTPPGTYTVLVKRPVVDYKGADYDFPNTKWNLMFKKGATLNYYIHGAYWHHNFGHPMSHGCINVAYSNMEKLYDWAEFGTPISIE